MKANDFPHSFLFLPFWVRNYSTTCVSSLTYKIRSVVGNRRRTALQIGLPLTAYEPITSPSPSREEPSQDQNNGQRHAYGDKAEVICIQSHSVPSRGNGAGSQNPSPPKRAVAAGASIIVWREDPSQYDVGDQPRRQDYSGAPQRDFQHFPPLSLVVGEAYLNRDDYQPSGAS